MAAPIMVVVGTRPECIKLAPVVDALRARGADVLVSATGQHRELLDQALRDCDLVPDHELGLMQPDQDLASLTARLLDGIAQAIARHAPRLIVVQGDTATAFAGALAGFHRRVPVAHVEAGLRSGDRHSPFPEEVHRRAIALMTDLHFAPTRAAADALAREGVAPGTIHVTGNTVVDALVAMARRLEADASGARLSPFVRDLDDGGALVLVTCHRRESFGEPLEAVCRALRVLAESHPAHRFAFPVHPNPQVCGIVTARLADLPNFHLLPPVSYADTIHMLARAQLVLTDSGGLQEEAPSFGVPVLVLREKTERMEAVEAGLADLVGTNERRIIARATERLSQPRPARGFLCANPFGDGRAAGRIADILLAPP